VLRLLRAVARCDVIYMVNDSTWDTRTISEILCDSFVPPSSGLSPSLRIVINRACVPCLRSFTIYVALILILHPLHRNHGLPSRLLVTDPTNAAHIPDPTHAKNVHHAYHLPSRREWTNLYFVIKIKKKVKTFGAIHPWVNGGRE
jgi:hypothetical protein